MSHIFRVIPRTLVNRQCHLYPLASGVDKCTVNDVGESLTKREGLLERGGVTPSSDLMPSTRWELNYLLDAPQRQFHQLER